MIYLVRHGETDWNLFKRCNGITDSFLNKTGIEQAKLQATNLKDISFDTCFCSPQTRARQFCEIIYQGSVAFDGRLAEIICGALEYFYKGLSGWIYQCDGDFQYNKDAGVFTTATSATPVPVASAEFIEDVYEHIMSDAEQGKIIYEKFESLRPYRHDIIRGIIYRSIKCDDLFKNTSHPNYTFIPDKYPQYWKEAKVLYENGLL